MTSQVLGLDVRRRGSIGLTVPASRSEARGGIHLLWALLVASGFAQPVMDFVFWLHFIRPVYVIEGFDVARAAGFGPAVLTGAIGYAMGVAFALLWNQLHRVSP